MYLLLYVYQKLVFSSIPGSIPDDYYNYYDVSDYYPYLGMFRRKRSAQQNKLMSAENMMHGGDAGVASTRVKRDLTADDIRNWIENGAIDYPDYGDEYEGESDPRLGGEDTAALEQLLQEYLDYGDGVPQEEEPSVDYPLSPYNLQQEEEEEQEMEDTKDRLALLQYLLEDIPAEREEEELYERRVEPEDVEESWEELDPSEEIEYEPIVYNGVPGIFIPTPEAAAAALPTQKRQFISMVPGNRKRSDFYPYNLEPEGGRWDAFIPQDEKRTADAYERLYRMAQALSRDQEQDDWY